jgi:hypothetical protein
MNPDGSGQVRVTTNSFLDAQPSWQPSVLGYPRPAGTAKSIFALVPAYTACTSANRTHGPPLAHASCNPPAQTSPYLTVGTPDANGKPAGGVSRLLLRTLKGNTSTSADEADVSLSTRVKDVLRRSDLTDYVGEIRMEVGVRVTDKNNTPHPGGSGPGTGSFALAWTVQCRTTAVTTRGGDCQMGTTADALVPGMVKEGARAIWQFDQVRVFDGGADFDADTAADNRLFFVQGFFVP